MTAEIAIMNKAAVALAADSAVTFSVRGEQKVFQTVNKLFSLSKYHPVGLMVYGNAEFMGIDWETIIKIYRKSIETLSLIELSRRCVIMLTISLNFFSQIKIFLTSPAKTHLWTER